MSFPVLLSINSVKVQGPKARLNEEKGKIAVFIACNAMLILFSIRAVSITSVFVPFLLHASFCVVPRALLLLQGVRSMLAVPLMCY